MLQQPYFQVTEMHGNLKRLYMLVGLKYTQSSSSICVLQHFKYLICRVFHNGYLSIGYG